MPGSNPAAIYEFTSITTEPVWVTQDESEPYYANGGVIYDLKQMAFFKKNRIEEHEYDGENDKVTLHLKLELSPAEINQVEQILVNNMPA